MDEDDLASQPKPSGRRMAAVLCILSALAALSFYLAMTTDSDAHDAPATVSQPMGWSYPFSCCSGYDCRPVGDKAVSERPEGYVIAGTGEVIPYTGDTRLRNSPDGETHLCTVAGSETGRVICLFVPPRGM